MTLPPGNSDYGTPSSEEPLFGEPSSTTDVYATPAYGASGTTTGSSSAESGSATQKVKDAAAGAKDKAADVKDTAVGKAADVKDSAVEAGSHVASVAKEQAGTVAAEAGQHARTLVTQVRGELSSQIASQQERLVGGIRSLSGDLQSMAGSGKSGIAADLARQASRRTDSLASYVESHEPADLVSELSSFARRRPGLFLSIAASAGLLAGRLARGIRDEASAGSTPSSDLSYTGTDAGYSSRQDLGSVGAGSVGAESFGSVGSVDAGFESGSYATGSYATSADPLPYEDGGIR